MFSRISERLRRVNAAYYPERIFLPPKWLVLGVNNTCNLHCKMCDVGVSNTQSNFFNNLMGSKPVHMPLELFTTIADQAAKYFPSVKLGYAFTEPLIYNQLEESLRYSKKKKLFTALTTNGLGLKKYAAMLDDANLAELNISIDGPPDVHNFIRGNEHSFVKAFEGIEALVQIGSKIQTNVYCVITEWNFTRLVEFLELLNPLPLTRVGLMHSNYVTQPVADHHNDLLGGLYEATASNTTHTNNESIGINELWEEIRVVKARDWNFPVVFFPELHSREALATYYQHPEIFIGKRCMDIYSNIMIKSNGDVIPAHGRCFNLKIGNLHESNLKEIWNSSVVAQFRKTVNAHGGFLPACSRCCSSFGS